MILEWIRFAASAGCLVTGLVFMILSVFGVNRLHHALNRMHAAAMGDTLGILFVFAGLMIMRGFSMDALKLFLVILFFWVASPVSGHMISRLEAMTDEELGEMIILHCPEKETAEKTAGKEKEEKTGPEQEKAEPEEAKAGSEEAEPEEVKAKSEKAKAEQEE